MEIRALVEIGIAGAESVVVDAKHGFIPLEVVHGQADARPRPAAMFLAMRSIREAAN